MLKVGDFIPLDHKVITQDDTETTFRSLLGSYLVIYFYPKDETPGCTIEACELRDYTKELERLGAKVIGVSKDSAASHTKFIKKHSLNFTLLADTDTSLMKAFGTLKEKKFMGRTFVGTDRCTFLVDPSGKVLHVWENVKPLGHGKDVFTILSTILRK